VHLTLALQLIRTRRLITESASWEPPELTDLSTLDRDWHTWVEYETLKRYVFHPEYPFNHLILYAQGTAFELGT
jgi:hypothetical protein